MNALKLSMDLPCILFLYIKKIDDSMKYLFFSLEKTFHLIVDKHINNENIMLNLCRMFSISKEEEFVYLLYDENVELVNDLHKILNRYNNDPEIAVLIIRCYKYITNRSVYERSKFNEESIKQFSNIIIDDTINTLMNYSVKTLWIYGLIVLNNLSTEGIFYYF